MPAARAVERQDRTGRSLRTDKGEAGAGGEVAPLGEVL